MTALMAVSSHLPESVSLADLQHSLELSDRELMRFVRLYGLSEVCRSTLSETELLLAAAGKLTALTGQESRVRYLVRATTVASPSPYPTSSLQEVRQALGLEHATTFAVSGHACASGLLAVDLCGTLLAADGDPDALALIFLGEKAFTPMAQLIPGVAVMGEGTAAVLVAADGDRDRVLGYASQVHGRQDGAVVMTPEIAAEFRQIYPDALGRVIQEALASATLSISDINLVLPHNVNELSWARTVSKLGLTKDQILLNNIPVTGHCFCADPFINHVTACELGRLNPGDRYLMVSVGLGPTFSAMVLQH